MPNTFGGPVSQPGSFTDYTGQSHVTNYGITQPKAPLNFTPTGTPQSILSGQVQNVNNLSYTPLDTRALAQQATQQAADNATRSLALEQQLSPGVSSTRTQLQDQTAGELAQGGNLPADVVNQVSRASAGAAGGAGLLGSQGSLTAASLGLTALNLANSRRANAANLLAANPVPVSGLSPEGLANATIDNTQAANQFALSKLGAQGNIAASQIAAIQAQRKANVGSPTTTLSAMPYVPLGTSAPQNDPWTGLPQNQISLGQQTYQNNLSNNTTPYSRGFGSNGTSG